MSYVEEFCEDIAIVNHGDIVLQGQLKDIKKDFGKNRLILSAINYDLEQLKNKCMKEFSEYISVKETKKEFLIIELMPGIEKKQLLHAILNSDVDTERFAIYEPTLTDIFVQKAGD